MSGKHWAVLVEIEVAAVDEQSAVQQVRDGMVGGSLDTDLISNCTRVWVLPDAWQVSGNGSLEERVKWANDVLRKPIVPAPDTPPVAPRVMQTGEARDRRKPR